MSEKPHNPSAFPLGMQLNEHGGIYEYPHDGMTLRDYFAAKALNGMMSAHSIFTKDIDAPAPKNMEPPKMRKMTETEVAQRAYEYADAMLKARIL